MPAQSRTMRLYSKKTPKWHVASMPSALEVVPCTA
jgi:hypothetical protein